MDLAQSRTWQALDGAPGAHSRSLGSWRGPSASQKSMHLPHKHGQIPLPLGPRVFRPCTATGAGAGVLRSWGCSWDEEAATQTHDERQEGRQPQERLWPSRRWEPNSILSEAPRCFPFQEPLANLLRTREIL